MEDCRSQLRGAVALNNIGVSLVERYVLRFFFVRVFLYLLPRDIRLTRLSFARS